MARRLAEVIGKHDLEDFQWAALDEIAKQKSVVVAAPTGSGKTLLAEAAIAAALDYNQCAFYTTPLKALSNQKFREFKSRYGKNIGLKTGENVTNPRAQVKVMTVEVFRNMLFESDLSKVQTVVMDEIHYLGDDNRGTVWEECIVHSPDHIQLICLSATIGNAEDLRGWIEAVHGPCGLGEQSPQGPQHDSVLSH